jgi:hypothetical protein
VRCAALLCAAKACVAPQRRCYKAGLDKAVSPRRAAAKVEPPQVGGGGGSPKAGVADDLEHEGRGYLAKVEGLARARAALQHRRGLADDFGQLAAAAAQAACVVQLVSGRGGASGGSGNHTGVNRGLAKLGLGSILRRLPCEGAWERPQLLGSPFHCQPGSWGHFSQTSPVAVHYKRLQQGLERLPAVATAGTGGRGRPGAGGG